jgi:hypothetical protein
MAERRERPQQRLLPPLGALPHPLPHTAGGASATAAYTRASPLVERASADSSGWIRTSDLTIMSGAL